MTTSADCKLLRPGAVDAPYELLSRYTHINRGGVNILYIMQDLLYTVQNIIAGIASVSQDPLSRECEPKFKIDVGQGRPRVTLQYDEHSEAPNPTSNSDDSNASSSDKALDNGERNSGRKNSMSHSDLIGSIPVASQDNSMDTWSSIVASEDQSENLHGSSPIEEIEVVPDVAIMCKELSLKTEPADDVGENGEREDQDSASQNKEHASDMQCVVSGMGKTWKESFSPGASNQVSIIRVNPNKGSLKDENSKTGLDSGDDQMYFNSTSSITISRIEQASEQFSQETVINSNNQFLQTPLTSFSDKCTIRNITRNVEYSSLKESYHISDNTYCGDGPSTLWPQNNEYSRNVRSMNFQVSQRFPNKVLYPCRHCGKQFRFLSQKDIHERVHTGEKPFKCKICKKRFSQIGTKRRHERTHTISAITLLPGNVT